MLEFCNSSLRSCFSSPVLSTSLIFMSGIHAILHTRTTAFMNLHAPFKSVSVKSILRAATEPGIRFSILPSLRNFHSNIARPMRQSSQFEMSSVQQDQRAPQRRNGGGGRQRGSEAGRQFQNSRSGGGGGGGGNERGGGGGSSSPSRPTDEAARQHVSHLNSSALKLSLNQCPPASSICIRPPSPFPHHRAHHHHAFPSPSPIDHTTRPHNCIVHTATRTLESLSTRRPTPPPPPPGAPPGPALFKPELLREQHPSPRTQRFVASLQVVGFALPVATNGDNIYTWWVHANATTHSDRDPSHRPGPGPPAASESDR